MDRYSGNRKVLQWLTRTREPLPSDPASAAATQQAFNQQRFARALKARSIWPYIIPLQFQFDIGGRPNPYSVQTPEFNDPVTILGAVHNFDFSNLSQSFMNMALNRESTRNIGLLGTDNLVQLDTRDFAGHRTQGPHYFSQPFDIRPGDRLNVDIYKTEGALGIGEKRYMCFLAERVLPNSDERAALSSDAQAAMRLAINARSQPEFRILKLDFSDTPGGKRHKPTNTIGGFVGYSDKEELPERNEPLLIRGFRSPDMRYSMISVYLGEDQFWGTPIQSNADVSIPPDAGPQPVPAWSFASLSNFTSGLDTNWQYLQYPFLVLQNETLTFNLTNAGAEDDPVVTLQYDPKASIQMEVLCETL